jgi:hypothetical protein
MKKVNLVCLIMGMVWLFVGSVSAQDNEKKRPSREQLAELQARHIAGSLALDDATAKKFVDAYRDYQQEVWNSGTSMKKRVVAQSLTDAEIEKNIKERFAHSRKLLDIREKYYDVYRGFLSPKQIQRVYELEKQVMKRFENKAGNKRMPQRRR